jgi:ribonuclease G
MSDEPKRRRRTARPRDAAADDRAAFEPTEAPARERAEPAVTVAVPPPSTAAARPPSAGVAAAGEPTAPVVPEAPGEGERDGGEPEIRVTEPGAWAALHARRTRGRRPGRRGRGGAAASDAAATATAAEAAPVTGAPAAAVDDDRDVIVATAAPDEALLERSPAPVSDEAMAAAAADRDVAPSRRRRRGRRGRGASAAVEAPAEEAAEPPTEARPEPDRGAVPAAPSPAERTSAASDVAASPTAGPLVGVEPEAATGVATDDEGDDAHRRRRRGHRGGRRHRRRNGDGEPSTEPAVAEVGVDGEALPGGSGSAADAAPAGVPGGAADLGAAAVAEGETPAGAATPDGAQGRRRRRRRGGDVAAADEAAESAAAPAAGREETHEAEPAEGVGRRRGGRLRRPKDTGVTADLPGHKEILVSEDAGEMRVALVEDGRLAEIYVERPGKRSYAGNIYRGKVDNVLPGMDAAFVDIGLERNGFLYVDDVADPEDGEKRPRKITQMLKAGQEILVQVSKDPMGSKGARLTGQLSLAGRYLVYVPGGSGVGVSRRLPADERDRLRELCKSLNTKNAGLIVRTVAEGKSVEEMKGDLRFLSRLWTRLKAKADKVKAPGLVYAEADVSLQVARDLYDESFAAVLVDSEKRRKELVAYLDKVAPELATRIRLYDGDESLFKAHGIEEQIARALERRVPLPSGGNLVIDHTEALTVIDVNTGRFTGGKGLEDTITRNNLEAAREVVRQLRLRDIGGIIIIDFIDMEFARNREAVLAKLQAELATDRTKTYVVEISPLGLVEMTRQNITDGARGILTQTCPMCEGKARVLSAETMAITIERRLGEHAGETQARALLLEVNTAVAERLIAGGRVKRLERATGKRIFLEGSRFLPMETFRIVAEGSLEAVESHRIPVREDEEVALELEYALTYSPGDAVAHVGGYQVIVLNGRRALGEKRKVRITSLTRAGAMGVIVS